MRAVKPVWSADVCWIEDGRCSSLQTHGDPGRCHTASSENARPRPCARWPLITCPSSPPRTTYIGVTVRTRRQVSRLCCRRTALRSREDTRLSACSPMPSAASNTPPGSKPGQQVLDDGMGLAQRLCGEHVANVHAVLASHDVIGVAKGSRRWRGTAPPTKRSIWYASSAGRTAHACLDRHRDCQPRLRSRPKKLTHRTESTKPDTSYLGDLAPKRCHDQSMPTDGVRFGGLSWPTDRTRTRRCSFARCCIPTPCRADATAARRFPYPDPRSRVRSAPQSTR